MTIERFAFGYQWLDAFGPAGLRSLRKAKTTLFEAIRSTGMTDRKQR